MPEFEELPDDYDPAVDASSATGGRAASGAVASSASGAGACGSREGVGGARSNDSSSSAPSGGLRRGFFTKQPQRPAEPSPVASSTASSMATSASASADNAPSAPLITQRPADITADVGAFEDLISPAELVDGLRRRLRGAAESLSAAQEGAAGVSHGVREAKELLSTIGSSVRWPTAQARSGQARAALEADTALAEMRSASNDARRLRSGDEKRALTELRRASEHVAERVRKLVEISVSKDMSDEDKTQATLEAFHALPLTAKLRLLADERVAVALLIISFVGGIVLVLGILLEVYTACGCGFRCGQ